MCFHDFMLRLKPYLYPHCYLLYSVLVDSLGFCYDTSPTCIIILLVRLVIKCLETEKPGTLICFRSASPELRMACLPSVWVFPLSPPIDSISTRGSCSYHRRTRRRATFDAIRMGCDSRTCHPSKARLHPFALFRVMRYSNTPRRGYSVTRTPRANTTP